MEVIDQESGTSGTDTSESDGNDSGNMEPMDQDTISDDLLELGLEELPPEVLECGNQAQFISAIKPYLIEIYPQATSYAIHSLAIRQFKGLKKSRIRQTELQILNTTKSEFGRGKRNAVKNLSKNVYTGGETMLELDKILSKRGAKMSNKKPPKPLLPHKRHSKVKHTLATGVGVSRESIRYKTRPKECDESEGSVGGASEVEPTLKRQKIGSDKSDQEDTDQGETTTKNCPQCHKIFHEEHSLTRHIKLVHDGKIDTIQKVKLSEESYSNSSSEGDDDDLYQSATGDPNYSEDDPPRPPRIKNTSDMKGEDSDHQDHCFYCKDGGELLCCDRCPKTFHVYCLNPPMQEIPDGEWRCAWCTAKPLSNKVETILYWRNHKGPDWDDLPEHIKTRLNREYFVKWKDTSYWQCSWVGEVEMEVFEMHLLRNYMKRVDMTTPPPLETLDRRHRKMSSSLQEPFEMDETEQLLIRIGIRREWLHVHRIINTRVTRRGREYLTKWRDLGYEYCSWETLTDRTNIGAEEAIKQYSELKESVTSGKKTGKKKKPSINPKLKYDMDPDFVSVTGGRLHPYQLEGLNWLRFSWANQIDTILADEMGLGKTIQTITFLNSLVKEGHSNGPFLISAPLTTIVNWEREFEFWAPDLYVVNYTGQKMCRQVIREHELSFQENATRRAAGKPGRLRAGTQVKFQVILTSYELVSNDSTLLQSIDWAILVVDEAHRLRNNTSLFFRTLSNFHIDYKLLLTGTPLQNNLEELFYLLNFLNNFKFRNCEQFLEQFQDMSKEEQVLKLHDLLGPHLLRRLKADVLKDIPSKSELIVRVDMEPLQKKIYKLILTRNFEALNTKLSAQNVSLITIMMDLKKCCNHPFLFAQPSEEAQVTPQGQYEYRGLVDACGKLKLLEKMLDSLKQRGHRVLIFSQMTKLLDLLEDFLEQKNYKYERIDGGVTGLDRQACIDRFNEPESELFVFLLSTRAGGLGINLATADTVIIYDSDWNPHNDIQAFSRAHRIGQTNKVMIYRFVTRHTVEERITEVAKRKMMLTHLIVRPGMGSANQNVLTKRELDDILKFGTEELFKDEQGKEGEEVSGRIVYDKEEIDRLLDRSQEGVGETKFGANDYLSSFKVATFALKDQEQAQEEEKEEPTELTKESEEDVMFWERVLRHHYILYKEQEEAKWGKGKRARKTVNYSEQGTKVKEKKDSDYMELSPDTSSLDDEAGDSSEVRGRIRKGKSLRSYKAALPLLMENLKGTLHVFGFNPRQRKSFLNAILRYGMPPIDAYSSQWMPRDLRSKPKSHFDAYVNMFMRHLCEPVTASPTFLDGVAKEGLVRNAVLTRMGLMRLVRNKVEQYKDVNCTYWIESQEARMFLGITMTTAEPIGIVPENSSTNVEMEDTNKEINSVCDLEPNKSGIATHSDTIVMDTEEQVEDKDTEPVNRDTIEPPQPLSNSSIQSEHNSGNEMDQEPTKEEPTDDNIPEPSTSHLPEPLSNSSSEQTEQTKMGFMFNIADGGFTELHSSWSAEKTEKPSPYKWGRRHDYWLLRGVLTHGYARWHEICNDKKLDILNMPFPNNPVGADQKFKYIPRRFKLLEQALAVEEQLNRASTKGLIQDPGQPIMFLHSRYTELECLADGHQALLPSVANGNKHAYTLLKKALVKMEELLNEMRQDINKLPAQLANQATVSQKLQLSDNNILTRLTAGIPSIQAGKQVMSSNQNSSIIQVSQPISAVETTTSSIQRYREHTQQQNVVNMLLSPNKLENTVDKQEDIIKTDLPFVKGHKIVSTQQKGQQTILVQGQPGVIPEGQQYQQAVLVQNPGSMIHQSGQTLYLTQSGTTATSQASSGTGGLIIQAPGQQTGTSYILVQQSGQSGQNLVLQPIQQVCHL
ncbi:Chromodomain helicase DNA binding protein 4 L homeolog [Oopsacas minuta]|uniref:Chromodomain helicase DNA binding protein 4 L homeolog n=1 Tax=Oopsacas minuta TaxID=111878 RepID=A0AAV7JYD9_9METZ|nr:Chromodomain helicase DNA binding protein 4 L homeolog [Oopsacas minuta]